MEYSKHIMDAFARDERNAQKERQAALVNRYNQKPTMPYNKFVWQSNSVERHETNQVNIKEIIISVLAIVLALGFLIAYA